MYVYMHISFKIYEETYKTERKIDMFTITCRDFTSFPETGKHYGNIRLKQYHQSIWPNWTLQQTAAEYTLFSSSHETFTR